MKILLTTKEKKLITSEIVNVMKKENENLLIVGYAVNQVRKLIKEIAAKQGRQYHALTDSKHIIGRSTVTLGVWSKPETFLGDGYQHLLVNENKHSEWQTNKLKDMIKFGE